MDRTAAAALFAWLDREIWLLTAGSGGRRGGLIATFVNHASLTPEFPRVVVGIARHHHTWELIEESGAFALHLLNPDNAGLVARFALQSGREAEKFAGLATHTASTGSPLLDDAVGWIDCKVETKLDTGDRTIYLAQVVEGKVTHFGAPLTARQLQAHLSPDVLAELKRLMHRDAHIDADAIRTWREANGVEPLGQQVPA
jgi:flavin reductase (DIM6/NTAB) family NADH-FMN oxidoreductase RutF